jgi:excisionase family DNA binding protein
MLSSLTGLLSLAEAAIHCGISQKTLERHIRAGRIRRVKVGRRTFVPAEEVVAVHATSPHYQTTLGRKASRNGKENVRQL